MVDIHNYEHFQRYESKDEKYIILIRSNFIGKIKKNIKNWINNCWAKKNVLDPIVSKIKKYKIQEIRNNLHLNNQKKKSIRLQYNLLTIKF